MVLGKKGLIAESSAFYFPFKYLRDREQAISLRVKWSFEMIFYCGVFKKKMVCRGRAEFEAPGNSEQLTDDLESVAELVREFPIRCLYSGQRKEDKETW